MEGLIDYELGLKTWVNSDVYLKALRSFARERKDDAVKIEDCLKDHADNQEPAPRIAHALKGVAGNLAIGQVACLANEIDIALKFSQPVETLLPKLHQALQAVCSAIESLNLNDSKSIQPKRAFDEEAVLKLLKELNCAFDELNPDAAEPLLAQLSDFIKQDELHGIYRELENFDFEAAADQTLRLAERLNLIIR